MADLVKKYEPFFGRWKVKRKIGSGTYGDTYEVYQDDNPTRVSCVKIVHLPKEEELQKYLRTAGNDYNSARKRFRTEADEKIRREVEILRTVSRNSNNIVRYEEHFVEEYKGEQECGWDLVLRMELLKPIKDKFSEQNVTQYDVIQMWLQLLMALSYCEEKTVLHRDIKPANIMISADGQYKLADFGEAIVLKGKKEATGKAGNEAYMAPEVYNRKGYDYRADLYSLGLVVYFYMNGQVRWFCDSAADDNRRATERRVSGEKIPSLENLSPEINNILLKMIAFNPEERYAHAYDVYRDLMDVLRVQESELKKKKLGTTKKKSFNWKIGAGIGGGVLAALIIFGVIKSMSGSGGETENQPVTASIIETAKPTETDNPKQTTAVEETSAEVSTPTTEPPKKVEDVEEEQETSEDASVVETTEVTETETQTQTETETETETETPEPTEAGPVDISTSGVQISLSLNSATYSGKVQKPDPTLKLAGEVLTEGIDYEVDYGDADKDWTSAGKYTLECNGKGDYTGSITADFEIKAKNIDGATISYDKNITEDGLEHKPDVEVKLGDKTLIEGTDYTINYGEEGDWTTAGKYTFTIEGINNYRSSETRDYTIDTPETEPPTEPDTDRDKETAKTNTEATETESVVVDIADAMIILTPTSEFYDGKEHKPEVTLKYNDQSLVQGTDYNIDYNVSDSDWTNAGEHTLKCTGIGNFTGEKDVKFTISPTSMKNAGITYNESETYNGSEKKPIVTVNLDDVSLEEDKDFKVNYGSGDWTEVGKYTFTIEGIGNYKDSCEGSFMITEKDLTQPDVKAELLETSRVYNGKKKVPEVKLTLVDQELKKDTDYTVDYDVSEGDWTNVGEYTLVIEGKGNFTGTLYKKYEITKESLEGAEYTTVPDKVFNGKEEYPKVKISLGEEELKEDKDYQIDYGEGNWTDAGTYAYTITGIGNYKGTKEFTFEIKKKEIKAEEIKYENTAFKDGESHKITDVKIQSGDTVLEIGKDYTVTCKEDEWIEEGTYHFTVQGMGNYTGTIEEEFAINLTPEQIERKERLANTYVIGGIESPEEGEEINSLRFKGWILVNENMKDFTAYVDMTDKKEKTTSIELDIAKSKDSDYQKLSEEHIDDITASAGYKVSVKDKLKGMQTGECKMALRIVVKETGEEMILSETNFSIKTTDTISVEEATGEKSDLYYVDAEKRFAVGLDLEDSVIEDNGKGVTLTGWFKALEGSSISPYLEIEQDGVITYYTEEELEAKGGSLQIERAQRMPKGNEGEVDIKGTELAKENGFVIQMKLPFLSEGLNDVKLKFTIGLSGETQTAEIKTLTLNVDKNSKGTYQTTQSIVKKWEDELPKPKETETETETEKETENKEEE